MFSRATIHNSLFKTSRVKTVSIFILLLIATVATHSTRGSHAASHKRQTLTFEDRIAAQRAIEEVYHRHRIWPKDNPQPKPALDEVMPESAIRAKVEDYLRQSSALEHYWQRSITGEELQAEIDRMAQQTKQPDVLRELWAALGNDPSVIAECLARPLVVERLSRERYASDERFHGELKRRAGSELNVRGAAGQMGQTSGEYREVVWVKDETEFGVRLQGLEINGELRMSRPQWQEQVSNMTGWFGTTETEAELPAGRWSGLQEDEERFFAVAVLEKGAERMKVASAVWRKVPFDDWWSGAQGGLSLELEVPDAEYVLLQVPSSPNQCSGESWTATSTTGAPSVRNGHAAVWTGTEMIVWGGLDGVSFLNTGGRYNPVTDTWTPTSTTGVPGPRSVPATVWTGSEMVAWGGAMGSQVDTGGRYNPATNTWRSTTSSNAPTARFTHTGVWSGSELIVWGGIGGSPINALNTGGRYNPVTDTWVSTSTINAPITRLFHSAVWTGSEMIIWGDFFTSTGGRYNPVTDTWAATSTTNAPAARAITAAVWTGSEMIIWGGGDRNTGGRYNPITNTWMETTTTVAPIGRSNHTGVWTGSEMIIWGGQAGTSPNTTEFNSGGRYNPVSDTWTSTSTTGAPSPRSGFFTAIWTGSAMIVWGGIGSGARINTGGRYTIASGLTISPTSQSFPASGGSGGVSVASASSCSWTATSNDTWITITSGSSGTGNGTVNFAVAANTGAAARTGTITITGQTFTVNQAGNDCHTITGLTSSSGVVGANVTINGTNFTGVNGVRFTNNVTAGFTVISATQINTTVPAGAVTGPITVSKTGCPDVQTVTFTVTQPNPVPNLMSLNPPSIIAGGAAFTLTVNGSNFVNGSVVRWNDSGRTTNFISGTQLSAIINAADIAAAGSASVTVVNPSPGGGTSNALTFTINGAVSSVSAASFTADAITPESIVAAFGTGLATQTLAASTLPLPNTLAGTTVKVRDSAGMERFAPLFFVAFQQVNYLMPPGTAPGTAGVTVTSGNGTISIGTVQVAAVAPGLFAANADGQGVAAADALRVRGDLQSYEPVARLDSAQMRYVSVPIDLGPESDQVFVILYGTGIRGRSALSAVTCRIGGVEVPVHYAGETPGYVGLDQVNVGPLPRSLAGRGEIDVVLTVDGRVTNTVKIAVR